MIMRRVSNYVLLFGCALGIVTSTFLGLVLSESRADAASARPVRETYYVTLGHQALTRQAVTQPGVVQPALPSAPTLQPQIPNPVTAIGGMISTGVDILTGGVSEVIDFVKAPFDAATQWLGRMIGGMIGWAGHGVISLVTGIREECFGSRTDGNQSNNMDPTECESRIAMDYFPSGSQLAQRAAAQFTAANTQTIADLRAQLRSTSDPDDRATINASIDRLQNNNTDPNGTNATLAAPEPPNANDVMYVPKSAVSSESFDREYIKYVAIALLLLVPMLIAAGLQSVITGKPVVLLRSVFLHLPACIFGMALAPYLTRNLMAITDSFSSFILVDSGQDMRAFFGNQAISTLVVANGVINLLPMLIVGLVFVFACLLIWFILSMREASVSLLTVFIPIAFAASVWPALGKWSVRAIKLLLAAIISKVFIVGAISLGIGVFSGSSAGGQLSFSHLIYGSTIFFIAAFSPHLVMKFFDELGEALNAAGGTGAINRALSISGNTNGTRQLLSKQGSTMGASVGKLIKGTSPIGKLLGK